jgi:hypothetical protein
MNPAGMAVDQTDPASVPGRVMLALIVLGMALLVFPDGPRRAGSRRSSTGSVDPRVRRVVVPVGVFAVGVAIAPGAWWLALGVSVALAIAVGRWPSRGSPRRRAQRRRWLIVHAELLASCLDSGLAMAAALRAVGEVLRPADASGSGPPAAGADDPSAALESVAAMLALGADAETAWRVVDADEDLAPLAAAARRSAAGGTTLADAVREHARQLREEAAQEAARSAGRAGVLMTAPLGACFLPAFLCLGLAPVVLGLLGQLTIR